MASIIHLSSDGLIVDNSENEYITFAATASAVNNIKITNAAADTAPIIESTGDDNNVNLSFKTKGTGLFEFAASATNTPATLRLNDSNNGQYVDISMPAEVNNSYSIVLPSAIGSDTQVLSISSVNNSVATLTWTNAGSGDITGDTTISNTTDDANAGILTLVNTRGGANAGENSDKAGTLVFKTNDSAANNQDFAKIEAIAASTTSTSESGKLDFQVATTTDGSLASIMTITGGAVANSSTVAILGDLTVSGGEITYGNGQDATLTVSSRFGNDEEGKNLTISAGAGTGSGAGGSIIFQTAPYNTSGTTPNFLSTALTIDTNKNATFTGSIFTSCGDMTLSYGNLYLSQESSFISLGTCNAAVIQLNNTGLTIDSVNDIVLDAGIGNVILKDDGNNYGTLSEISGTLNIKGGTSGTDMVKVASASIYTNSTYKTMVFNDMGSVPTGISNGAAVNSTFIGADTAASITTGKYNTTVGYSSGNALTTGDGNTLFGNQSGGKIPVVSGTTHTTDSTQSTVVLDGNASSDDDTYNDQIITVTNGASGNSADMIATITDYTGSTKTATISVISGEPSANGSSLDSKEYLITEYIYLTTGPNNTCIGYNSGVSSAGSTNQTSIGYQARCSSNNQITLGNSSVTELRCGVSTITSISDQRDKTNITDLTYGLTFVNTLKPREFEWNYRTLTPSDANNPKNGTKQTGFIAQELQESMSGNQNEVLRLVNESNLERLEISPGNLIPILVKAIQELSASNSALEARVAALESA